MYQEKASERIRTLLLLQSKFVETILDRTIPEEQGYGAQNDKHPNALPFMPDICRERLA